MPERSAGDEGDLKWIGLSLFGHGDRDRLGIAGAGKPTHADGHAVLDEVGSSLRRGYLVEQGFAANAVFNHGNLGRCSRVGTDMLSAQDATGQPSGGIVAVEWPIGSSAADMRSPAPPFVDRPPAYHCSIVPPAFFQASIPPSIWQALFRPASWAAWTAIAERSPKAQ